MAKKKKFLFASAEETVAEAPVVEAPKAAPKAEVKPAPKPVKKAVEDDTWDD